MAYDPAYDNDEDLSADSESEENKDYTEEELYVPFLEAMYDTKKYKDIFLKVFDVDVKEYIALQYKSFPQTLAGNILMFNIIDILQEDKELANDIVNEYDNQLDYFAGNDISSAIFNMAKEDTVFEMDPETNFPRFFSGNKIILSEDIRNKIQKKLGDNFFIFLMGLKSKNSPIYKYFYKSNIYEKGTLKLILNLLGGSRYITHYNI